MAKDPAFLFYTGDFATGTQFFSDSQVGIYIRLLMAQHQHGRLSEKQVLIISKTIDKEIMIKFKKDEYGFFFNERLENEVTKRKAFSESRSDNRKGKTKQVNNTSYSSEESLVIHMENENIIKDVINYLNKESEKSFRENTPKTISVINARLKEKYTIEDFYKVIKLKVSEWKGTNMDSYLRPETLFGSKFESYLNSNTSKEDSIKTDRFSHNLSVMERTLIEMNEYDNEANR